MTKTNQSPEKKLEKRRRFLSHTAAIGGMALLGTAVSPAEAGKRKKKVRLGNARVKDFEKLVGKKFKLIAQDGSATRARLIEANAPETRRALRFRREQFSIVFDVPDGFELEQGRYRIKHSKLGSMDLFMVPVDLPSKFNRLEAAFT